MLPLILASSSPFRRALLDKLMLDYQCDSPDIDETQHPNESAESLVSRLALEKALAVSARQPNSLIIGSDQVAVLDGEIITKPHTHEKAIQQLQHSSGKHVRFLTGLCLLNSHTQQHQVCVEEYAVKFLTLSDQQIENYLQKEQPYQCAGSFKSEGLGITLFEQFEGQDPNSLIGLPLIKLVAMLRAEGVDPLAA